MILVGAQRVAHGELPFRDFFALYPPGQYYTVAALLGWIDDPVVALRLYCIGVRALIALLLYVAVCRLAGRGWAIACWGAALLWLTGLGFYGYPVFPALLLLLLGSLLLAQAVDRARTAAVTPGWRSFAAGAMVGAAALFRHDLAFYGLVASTPFLIALVWPREAAARGVGRRAALAARLGWPYLAGIALAFGVPAAALLAAVPVREVVFELFVYPSTTYAAARGLPYPPLFPQPLSAGMLTSPVRVAKNLMNLPFYAPLLCYALGWGWLGAQIARRRPGARLDERSLALASLLLLGSLGFNLVRVRSDAIHGTVMILPSYAVAAFLMWRLARGGQRAGRLAAAALGSLCLLSLLWPVRYLPWDSVRGWCAASSASQCRDFGSERVAAAAFLRSVVPPGERIFVGCARHDRVLVNEPILYLLADRLPGAKYHTLDPGVVTTLPVQREIVDDLIRHRVEYVVRAHSRIGASRTRAR
jgi:hypothetical protein